MSRILTDWASEKSGFIFGRILSPFCYLSGQNYLKTEQQMGIC